MAMEPSLQYQANKTLLEHTVKTWYPQLIGTREKLWGVL